MEKVLVLDGNERPALAITRSLGKRGIQVVVGSDKEKSLAGVSRYCSERLLYPSPMYNSNEFINTITQEIKKRAITIIYPVTEITTYLILKYRERFGEIKIPFASFDKFEILTNKISLMKLAEKLNVPIPETHYISNTEDIYVLKDKLKYPVVIKPCRSRILTERGWINASVKYAYSEKELVESVESTYYFKSYPFLLQQFIKGEGRGVFALYNHGQPIVFFAHRRLREKPPSGGVSVLCESIPVDPVLRGYSERILNHVKWHGVAMAEFKVSEEGLPYLMEINARFWGSLQLAIDAGVDFPWLLYQIETGICLDRINSYRKGVKLRWLLGDFDNLYLTFKSRTNIIAKIFSLIRFLNLFARNTHYEINRLSDFKPFLFELEQYFKSSNL